MAIAPGRADQAAAIRKTGVDLTVVLDSLEAVRVLEAAARLQGVVMPALIEIDSDGHRSGVQPHDELLIAIGRALTEGDAVELRGVMTHAGESYACRSVEALVAMAEQERERAVFCAERLRAAGLECPVVSVGSTPTATFAAKLDGVTEVRAGVYMVNDLVMAGLGVARTDDIALSVLTTVIGHQPGQNRVIIDAGWMALSRDRGTASQAIDHGYGQACDLRGSPLDELIVSDANQEHGIVTRRDGGAIDFAALPIGARLRILPNHACATAAQHDQYQVLDNGMIVGQWPRIRGW